MSSISRFEAINLQRKSISGGEVTLGGEFTGGEINVNPCYEVCFNLSYGFGMSWKSHANLALKKYVTG